MVWLMKIVWLVETTVNNFMTHLKNPFFSLQNYLHMLFVWVMPLFHIVFVEFLVFVSRVNVTLSCAFYGFKKWFLTVNCYNQNILTIIINVLYWTGSFVLFCIKPLHNLATKMALPSQMCCQTGFKLRVRFSVWPHLSYRFGKEIISMAIPSLPLIHIGQLSVNGESMGT